MGGKRERKKENLLYLCLYIIQKHTQTHARRHTHIHDSQGPELWLGIKLSSKGKGRVRVQFLKKVEGQAGMFTLTMDSNSYASKTIAHTFKDVTFVETTTFMMTANGQRLEAGKVVTTVTREPFDADVLIELAEEFARQEYS